MLTVSQRGRARLHGGLAPLRTEAGRHRARALVALGVGVLFTGLIYGLFKAIELNDVPTAVLSYFCYPLLTGSRRRPPGSTRCAGAGWSARWRRFSASPS